MSEITTVQSNFELRVKWSLLCVLLNNNPIMDMN